MIGFDHERILLVREASELVHPACTQELGHEIHESRSANTFGTPVSDHACVDVSIVLDAHAFDGSVESGHAAGDGAALECRAGGARGCEDAFASAHDELGVGADIHESHRAVFAGQVDGKETRRRVGSDMAADERHAVHAGTRMDG